MNVKKNMEINFNKKAIYKIIVNGVLNDSYSNKFTGMQLKIHRGEKKSANTTLIGEIKDQAALSGILNSLYDMQFTIISVNMLIEKTKMTIL